MVDPKLQEYTSSMLARGYTAEQLKISLLQQGWSASEIDAAINTKPSASLENSPANNKRPKSKLFVVFIVILAIILIFVGSILMMPSKQFGISGVKSLTPDVALKSVCDADSSSLCFSSVATYNNNISACDMVSDAAEKDICIDIIKTGKLVYREYTTGTSSAFDSKPFFKLCNQTCTTKKMQFNDTKSVYGWFTYDAGKSVTIMVCYCY